MSGDDIHTKALERATEALVKIESHEKVCSDRYREIATGQKAIFNKLDEISKTHFNRWMGVSSAVILLLLAVIGFLYKTGGI